jgi:hypothetical protein
MLSEYKWILLQNLNDGLFLIWLALLVVTTLGGITFFTDTRWDGDHPFWQAWCTQKKRWLWKMLGILFLLGTILIALPDKEQIALLRGEPVCHPSETKPFFEKKVIIMPVE